ncbi:MAG: hypothetical protein IT495_18345 [Gammaproteobacteria bacterium]|nr:hypothetical protein [Gammaproteobacteria bacterium]
MKANVTGFSISDTAASGGSLATDGTGTQFLNSTRLMANNLFQVRDNALLGYLDGSHDHFQDYFIYGGYRVDF